MKIYRWLSAFFRRLFTRFSRGLRVPRGHRGELGEPGKLDKPPRL